MSQSPYSHLSDKQYRALLERCSSGDQFVFAGEKFTVPGSLATQHQGLASGLFEVAPEDLLEVAKHIERDGDGPGKTIERAYSLICEAHVFSRNLSHWNEKSRRDHFSPFIHNLVCGSVISDGLNEGKVHRNSLLTSFLEAKNKATNQSDTRKLFNLWVTQSLRHRSFSDTIPWHPQREDFDEEINKQLYAKGWIYQIRIGTSIHHTIPEETSPPAHRPKRKWRDGEHITRPWWNTKHVWWPNPSQLEIKEFKAQYLDGRGGHFQSAYRAKQALTKFERWLEIEDATKEQR